MTALPRKRRPTSHVVDTDGTALMRANLPSAWIARPYSPDYGIDFDVELFGADADGGHAALGEHLLVQLKSRSRIKHVEKTVFGRFNVEKHRHEENADDEGAIRVLPIEIDTSDLALALSMGAAAPLMLVVCELATVQSYFLCLNDVAEKIILPRDGALPATKRTTVYVPEWNRLSCDPADIIVLRFYAKRAKLLAAFNKMRYQFNEIGHDLPFCEHMDAGEFASSRLVDMLLVFIDVLQRYDFWRDTPGWPIIELMDLRITEMRRRLTTLRGGAPFSSFHAPQLAAMPVPDEDRERFAQSFFLADIEGLWRSLANLGNVFEEICREWFLPTRMGSRAEQLAFRDSVPAPDRS